jgi:hypothetical protein
LGTLGDSADLIVRKAMKTQGAAVQPAAPFPFSGLSVAQADGTAFLGGDGLLYCFAAN